MSNTDNMSWQGTAGNPYSLMNPRQLWNHLLTTSHDIANMPQQHNISMYGFLPSECENRLPVNFEFLTPVVDGLSEQSTSGDEFRALIHGLPEYSAETHKTCLCDLSDGETRTLYSVLTMIVNRYIWCTGVMDAKNFSLIPSIIAIPLVQVSDMLGIQPTLTHSAVDLWNWKLTDPTQPFGLDNIDVINTLTGDDSEKWFYKVMIAIEGISGECVMMTPIIQQHYNRPEIVKGLLTVMNEKISEAVVLIRRMGERCDPEFFFDRLRIYLGGSKNDNLPRGVSFDLRPLDQGLKEYRLIGGSAAQSTLIQVYDVLFGVKHDGHGGKFLATMRSYMPRKHRDFLEKLEAIKYPLSQYVKENKQTDPDLETVYLGCLNNLMFFRKAHIELVHNYIIKMKNRPKPITPVTSVTDSDPVDDSQNNKNAHGDKGSGGTDPIEFCTEIINDTKRTVRPTQAYDRVLPLVAVVVWVGLMYNIVSNFGGAGSARL